MGTDAHGVIRCLLITVRSRRDGMLIDAQGYDYARYSAYIRDKSRLSLRDIPVEHYNLKLREHQKGLDPPFSPAEERITKRSFNQSTA